MMRRKWKAFVIAGVLAGGSLLFSAGAYAGMVGAPEGKIETEGWNLLDSHRVSIGSEADWILDKDMKVADRKAERVLLSRAYRARIGYRPLSPAELYGLIGAADLELESLDSTGDRIRDEYGYGTQVGGGLKTDFQLSERWWDLLVSLDGQFLYGESDVQTSSGSRSGREINSRGEILARQYHAAFTAGKAYSIGECQLVPYVGGRWSQFTLRENDRDSDNLIIPKAGWRADDHIGVLAGLSIQRGKHWQLTVEGRFVDETAVSASGRFQF